jgi:hypothetical protein
MDRIGLRTLIDVGVDLISSKLAALRSTSLEGASRDDDILSTLDRFAQLGTLLLQHNVLEIWQDLMSGFEAILTAGLPANDGLDQVSKGEAAYQLLVGQRLFALGGLVRLQRKDAFLRSLCFIHPNKVYPDYYWSRYLVTMVSRGELEGFRKSAIPQSADFVRERPEIFALYRRDMDTVVNTMCQFDLLQCVAITAMSKNVHLCYPNFGTYFNGRTMPAIKDLVEEPKLREMLAVSSDAMLAEILHALDEYAVHAFINVNGWRSGHWPDATVANLLKAHPKTRNVL